MACQLKLSHSGIAPFSSEIESNKKCLFLAENEVLAAVYSLFSGIAMITTDMLVEIENRMKTERLVSLPISLLWGYREFKRDKVPAPRIPLIGINMYDVFEITEYIQYNGIDPLELSIIKDKALLTDGNHRIVAAKRLGYTEVPVKITVYICDGRDTFYDHTLERFKFIDSELEFYLKKLFL